jgi:hypothetical protein
MSAHPERAGAGRRWGLRAALVAGSLFLAEALVRVVLTLGGLPQGPAGIEERLRSILNRFGDNVAAKLAEEPLNTNPERRFSHPFQGWETEEGLARLDEELRARAAGRTGEDYQLWLLGGSVAYNFAQGAGGERLVELLAADPRFAGRRIALRNHAHPEYKAPQPLMLVGFLLSLGLEPDGLIVLDGFNEAAIGLSNVRLGSHPAYPSIAAWSALQAPREDDPEHGRIKRGLLAERERARRGAHLTRALRWSALLGWAGLLEVQGCQRRWSALVSDYERWIRGRRDEPRFRGPELASAELGAILDAIATAYEASARALHALARSRGAAYLHVLQPTMNDGSKPLSPEERALPALKPAWIEGVTQGYPRLRTAGAALRREGLAFEDASDVFQGITDTLYYDAIHFDEDGNALLAERIARAFLAALEKP